MKRSPKRRSVKKNVSCERACLARRQEIKTNAVKNPRRGARSDVCYPAAAAALLLLRCCYCAAAAPVRRAPAPSRRDTLIPSQPDPRVVPRRQVGDQLGPCAVTETPSYCAAVVECDANQRTQ